MQMSDDECKSQVPTNSDVNGVKTTEKMQKSGDLACISCKKMPVIVTHLVEVYESHTSTCIITDFLTETPEVMTIEYEDCVTLDCCGRRLCEYCEFMLSLAERGVNFPCPCGDYYPIGYCGIKPSM